MLARLELSCYDADSYVVSNTCGGNYNPIEVAGYVDGVSVSAKGSFQAYVTQLSITYTGSTSGSVQTQDLGNNDADKTVVLNAECSGLSTFNVVATTNSGSCDIVVKVPCDASEICSGRRMRDGSLGEGVVDESDESFKDESVQDGDDEEETEDVPYCLSEDFPCEGEDENMVYVCHYIPRKGYQTFCVHEADSVILGFYPNDYCGPCEGGYGNVGK